MVTEPDGRVPNLSPGAETDPLCASDAELDALAAAAEVQRFAVIGDSLSLGVGDPRPGYPDAGWAEQVASRLRGPRADLAYLNSGVIGARTSEVVREQLDAALAFAPDVLHLPSGGNDILARDPDFAAIERDLRMLYDAGARSGTRLVAFTLGRAYSIGKIPDFGDRVQRINDATRALIVEFGGALVDMWAHPVNDRSDLVSADGVHFSAVGQAVLATEALRALAGQSEL